MWLAVTRSATRAGSGGPAEAGTGVVCARAGAASSAAAQARKPRRPGWRLAPPHVQDIIACFPWCSVSKHEAWSSDPAPRPGARHAPLLSLRNDGGQPSRARSGSAPLRGSHPRDRLCGQRNGRQTARVLGGTTMAITRRGFALASAGTLLGTGPLARPALAQSGPVLIGWLAALT